MSGIETSVDLHKEISAGLGDECPSVIGQDPKDGGGWQGADWRGGRMGGAGLRNDRAGYVDLPVNGDD